MWDACQSTDDHAYGTEANDILLDEAPKRGPCLADGMGRNGVYLAGLGAVVQFIARNR